MNYYESGRVYRGDDGKEYRLEGNEWVEIGKSTYNNGRNRFIKGMAFYGLVVAGGAYGINRLIDDVDSKSYSRTGSENVETKSGRNKLPEEVDFESITWSGGRHLDPRTFNRRQWPNIYKWGDLIVKYSKKHKFEPELIAAQAWVENSEGNPKTYSKSGAVGLLQVMPRDGIASGFKNKKGEPLFAKRPSIKQLQDPEFNVSYAVGMLKNLYDKYGTIADALKSYGPINVGYEYADMVLWLKKRL